MLQGLFGEGPYGEYREEPAKGCRTLLICKIEMCAWRKFGKIEPLRHCFECSRFKYGSVGLKEVGCALLSGGKAAEGALLLCKSEGELCAAALPGLDIYCVQGALRRRLPLQQEEKLFALILQSHNMHLRALRHKLQIKPYICHRGDLNQQIGSNLQQLCLKRENIRLIIFKQDKFSSASRCAPGRVCIDKQWSRLLQLRQHLPAISRNHLYPLCAKKRKILPRCAAELGIALYVEMSLPKRAGNEERIYSHSARNICCAPLLLRTLQNSLYNGTLVERCLLRAALLYRERDGVLYCRMVIQERYLIPQLPPCKNSRNALFYSYARLFGASKKQF